MDVRTIRWLLAPIRQWRAYRLISLHGPALSYPTAWALISLQGHPEELHFISATPDTAHTDAALLGLDFDDWTDLPPKERARRALWLQRHGRSPVQLLGISEELLEAAGLQVLDWGPPGPPC